MSTPPPDPIADGKFITLQKQVAAEILTKSYFSGLTIIVEDDDRLANSIDQNVEAAKGLLIMIETPEGDTTKPGVFGAIILDSLDVDLLVVENPAINRGRNGARKPAAVCVEKLIASLHGFRPAVDGKAVFLKGFKKLDDKLIAYRIAMRTSLVLPSEANLAE